MATFSDLSDLETQSLHDIKRTLYMDLISIPPSVLNKQQSSQNLLRHAATDQQKTSLTQHAASTQGFYSRVISASQPKRYHSIRKNSFKVQQNEYFDTQEKETSSNMKSTSQMDPTSHSLYYLLIDKEKQIDELQKQCVKQRNLSSKQQNKQGINFMTGFTDSTIETLRGVAQWSNLSKEQQDQLNEIVRHIIDFTNGLNDIFRLQQRHVQQCSQRLTLAENLTKMVEQSNFDVEASEIFSIRRQMAHLLESVNSVQSQELSANCLFRDLQKLMAQYEKILRKSEHQEKSVIHFKKNYHLQNEENLIFKKSLRKEKDQNAINARRVNTLEQRLEVLQGQESHKRDKDALRNIIDEMIKENEQNKRKAFQKAQEVAKLEQQVSELKEKNHKLTRRNFVLEKQLKTFGFNSYDLSGTNGIFQIQTNKIPILEESMEEDQEEMKSANAWDEIFLKGEPAKRLDFKLDTLKPEYKVLLQDGTIQINESSHLKRTQVCSGPVKPHQGPYRENKDNTMLFMDQYVQFKYLGEKINSLIKFILDSLALSTNEQLMQHASEQLPINLQCEASNLWLIDQASATFYSINSRRDTVHALIDSDTFFQLVTTQKVVYQQTQTLEGKSYPVAMYRDANTDASKMVKDCLLVPILFEGRIVGLISANNFPSLPNVVQNATYVAMLASFFISKLLQKFSIIKMINYKLKYKNILHEAMQDLCQQRDLYAFQRQLQSYAEKLFGVLDRNHLLQSQSTLFYYYHQQNLVTYKSVNDAEMHNSELGVAGLAIKTQQSILVNNITQHASYHQRIDLLSPLPVFVIPIVDQSQGMARILSDSDDESHQLVVGVLQINLNQRAKLSAAGSPLCHEFLGKQIDIKQFFGPTESLQTMASMFAEVVSLSYHYVITIIKFH